MPSKAKWDVIISGAGPAGSTCALFLGQAGKKVLLLDQSTFPRDKICADNKTWKCLDIVKELGLWKSFQQIPKKEINGVLVASPCGNELYTPLWKKDVKEKGCWYNVRRMVFDAFLAKAASKNKNVTLKENCKVISPMIEKDQVVGVVFEDKKRQRHEVCAQVVVGADGSTSPIANAVGLSPKVKGRYAVNARCYFKNVSGTSDRCELYYLKGICPGYFWIFPVDKGMSNVGIGMRLEDIERQGIDLEQKLWEVIHSERFKDRFVKAKQLSPVKKWGLSVLGKRRPCSGAGFVLCGDAGTFAMTFSGEGVGPSMRTGKIAAQTIVTALNENDVSADSLKRYDDALWKILEPEVKGFKWLEFLILHEKIFDWVTKRTAQKPELIDISSKMQREYALSQQMVSPVTVLKLLMP